MLALEQELAFRQKVVSIGGGTGQYSLLTGLRRYNHPSYITAIAGTWDDGGDSGRRRVDEGIIPPGDARQCILALCQPGRQMRAAQALFNYRNHRGDSLGNEIIEFYGRWAHGDQEGLDATRDLLLIDSEVLYVTPQDLKLYAETAKGIILAGESSIDTRYSRDDFDQEDRIVSLYFDTDANGSERAIKVILSAEKIIISSGSLYGSLLPHFLVEGIPEAIRKSKAKLIFVANLMSERGQTDGYKVSDHLEPIQEFLEVEQRMDYIIVGSNHLSQTMLQRYEAAEQRPVELDEQRCRNLAPKAQIIKESVASYTRRRHLYRHDHRLAKTILELE